VLLPCLSGRTVLTPDLVSCALIQPVSSHRGP
jgi:hypothetical protein